MDLLFPYFILQLLVEATALGVPFLGAVQASQDHVAYGSLLMIVLIRLKCFLSKE
jgi:hypothetical protein